MEKAFYHVIARGNQGDSIFFNNEDKAYFLSRLEKGAERHRAVFYAYCLMGNHYHLLLETREPNLSRLMHFINSSYATHLRSQGRLGHIFSGRYKSILSEKNEFLAPLSRYVHMNPVKASMVKKPEHHAWSSHRFYAGGSPPPGWLDTSWILGQFGGTWEAARARYCDYVEERTLEEFSFTRDQALAGVILGSEGFTREIAERVSREGRIFNHVTARKLFDRPASPEDLFRATCSFYCLKGFVGIDGKLDGHTRHARNMFIWLAKEYSNALNREIAAFVGVLSDSGITRQYMRIKEMLSLGSVRSERDERDECVERAAGWMAEAQRILSIVGG